MFNRIIKLDSPVFDNPIEDLRISFQVTKSLIGSPNLAEIVVYNLDADHRNLFDLADNLNMSLEAGYEDEGTSLLFKGQIVNSIHEYNKPNWITKFFCSDSEKPINDSTINKTLPAGATPENIFDELVSEMTGVTKGLTEGLKSCITGKKSLLRKITTAGGVKDLLNQLSKD